MTEKTAPRKDSKMNTVNIIGNRAKTFMRQTFQPKEFYADEMKKGYSLIVEISDELKKVRDLARERDDDREIIDGIDKAGQTLAKFSKKYAELTLKMLRHVE